VCFGVLIPECAKECSFVWNSNNARAARSVTVSKRKPSHRAKPRVLLFGLYRFLYLFDSRRKWSEYTGGTRTELEKKKNKGGGGEILRVKRGAKNPMTSREEDREESVTILSRSVQYTAEKHRKPHVTYALKRGTSFQLCLSLSAADAESWARRIAQSERGIKERVNIIMIGWSEDEASGVCYCLCR